MTAPTDDEVRALLDGISSPPWACDHDEREGYEWNIHIIDYDWNRVAFMATPGGKSMVEQEANARLIAAAPLPQLTARIGDRRMR
jgi:hypothetical protein